MRNDARLRAMPLDVLLNRYESATYWRNEYPGDKRMAARHRAYREEVERRITPLADRQRLPPTTRKCNGCGHVLPQFAGHCCPGPSACPVCGGRMVAVGPGSFRCPNAARHNTKAPVPPFSRP